MQVKQSASWKDLHWIHLGWTTCLLLLHYSLRTSFSQFVCLWAQPPSPPPPRQPQPALSGKLLFLSSAADLYVCLSFICLSFCLLLPSPAFAQVGFFWSCAVRGEKKIMWRSSGCCWRCAAGPSRRRPPHRPTGEKKVTVQVGKTTWKVVDNRQRWFSHDWATAELRHIETQISWTTLNSFRNWTLEDTLILETMLCSEGIIFGISSDSDNGSRGLWKAS